VGTYFLTQFFPHYLSLFSSFLQSGYRPKDFSGTVPSNKCSLSLFHSSTFSIAASNWSSVLQELKELEEPDCYDKEELEIQQNTLEEYFQEYRTYTREPTEDQLEAAMEKVLEWNNGKRAICWKGTGSREVFGA